MNESDATRVGSFNEEVVQLENIVGILVEKWRYQSRVGPLEKMLLILLYSAMILFGAVGNTMVIYVVIRNPTMRTARNVFIVNLAVSDLMLCLITMPLTLVEILYMTWQFGNYPAACPLVALLQGTSIFLSSLSIAAIALDRRRLIVSPHAKVFNIKGMLLCLPCFWALSIFLASPMALWKKLEYWTESTNVMKLISESTSPAMMTANIDCNDIINGSLHDAPNNDNGNDCLVSTVMSKWLHELQSCKEDFPKNGRLIYSTITIIIQYFVPTITISVANYQIYGQLRIRMRQKIDQLKINNQNQDEGTIAVTDAQRKVIQRLEMDIRRMKRTTTLLISIGVIFCVCWLPLNIVNIVMDVTENDRISDNGVKLSAAMTAEQYCILYSVCHVTGMLSACANPIIYGYLNENFNREFKLLFRKCLRRNSSPVNA